MSQSHSSGKSTVLNRPGAQVYTTSKRSTQQQSDSDSDSDTEYDSAPSQQDCQQYESRQEAKEGVNNPSELTAVERQEAAVDKYLADLAAEDNAKSAAKARAEAAFNAACDKVTADAHAAACAKAAIITPEAPTHVGTFINVPAGIAHSETVAATPEAAYWYAEYCNAISGIPVHCKPVVCKCTCKCPKPVCGCTPVYPQTCECSLPICEPCHCPPPPKPKCHCPPKECECKPVKTCSCPPKVCECPTPKPVKTCSCPTPIKTCKCVITCTCTITSQPAPQQDYSSSSSYRGPRVITKGDDTPQYERYRDGKSRLEIESGQGIQFVMPNFEHGFILGPKVVPVPPTPNAFGVNAINDKINVEETEIKVCYPGVYKVSYKIKSSTSGAKFAAFKKRTPLNGDATCDYPCEFIPCSISDQCCDNYTAEFFVRFNTFDKLFIRNVSGKCVTLGDFDECHSNAHLLINNITPK
jgi:hypothetical protein